MLLPALLPVLVLQGLWVALRAARLPEARGPRMGRQGTGPTLRLLILGDSSAAGVGAPMQDDALAGQLLRRLAPHHDVNWRLEARSGATVKSATALLDDLSGARFDVVITALGVNDTKNGVSRARWSAGYAALLNRLRQDHGAQLICVCAVPPLGAFPLLPDPLRSVLGARGAAFDVDLRMLCAQTDGAVHVPFDMPLAPHLVAEDGFHPSPALYALWADRLAALLLSQARSTSTEPTE